MNRITLILAFAILTLLGKAYSQEMPEEDKIIAVVGNSAITWSDLIYQMTMYAHQNHLTQLNQAIEQQVLLSIIADKLMLAKADQDSIMAPDDEVQKQMNFRLKSLVDEYGSERNLEEANKMSMAKIKEVLRENIKQSIKVDKLKQQKFGSGIKITRQQIVDFFNEKKDSLPPIPETFELYGITRAPGVTEEAKRLAYAKAKMILDSLKAGADFSEMAKKYSDDSASAVNGGNIGIVKKGSTFKEFEDAALLLKPAEISDIIETSIGYHIIKMIDKAGDEFNVKQILVKYPRLESADFEAINYLKDLKAQALTGQRSFKELALLYSQDAKTAKDSGYVGKIPATSMDSSQAAALRQLKPGDISDPIRIGDPQQYSYYIFYVKDVAPEHKASLETDYTLIQNMAQNYEENKELTKWLDELRKTIYVDIKQ